jgi:hypothetical protein
VVGRCRGDGVWSLERGLSDPPTTGGPEATLHVTQTADGVSFVREEKGSTSTSATLFFDGRPPNTAGGPVPKLLDYAAAGAKLGWKGTRLVIEGGSAGDGDRLPTTLREEWRLDPETGFLWIEREFDGGNAMFRHTEVFRKAAD